MTLSAKQVLNSVFGYDEFRHQQQAIIDSVVAGEDVLTLMPTGGGKSLCYQIPAIVRPGVGIVVSPLIALMKDQVDALEQLGIQAAYLNSSLDPYEQQQVEELVYRGEVQLLYVAPERLLMERTLNLLSQCQISLFAIDEAHCVSQWGHDFRPEYQQLSILQQRFSSVPRIALTATADQKTKQEIIDQLGLNNAQVFSHSFDRPNIRYHVSESSNARNELWSFINENHPQDAGVVYCLSRKKVDETAQWLREQGRHALPYHAGMNSTQREENQRRFLREDSVIIVATVAFGMGIDKPDVRFVAHLSLPKTIEAYYQETGRAGRDGEPANAWMSYGMQDMVLQRQMVENSEGSEQYKQVQLQKLNALLGYCELISCRRQSLLAYFGESLEQPCGNCDNCLAPPKTWDATQAVQKALSTVYRCDQRFAVTYLTNVLLGKADQRITRFGHDKISTFGIGTELNANQWKGVFRQLIAMNLLKVTGEYNQLSLTAECRPILQGKQKVELRELRQSKAKSTNKKRAIGDLSADDQQQFDALKSVRSELAKEQNVPAYIICHDASLKQMAKERPSKLSELHAISGFGDTKIEKYGERFISVITSKTGASDTLTETQRKTVQLFHQLSSVEQTAASRELSLNTVVSHLAAAIEIGECELSQVVTLTEQQIETIANMAQQVDFFENKKLKELFEALNEEFSYSDIKCVLAHLVSSSKSKS
ncbi:DNA helicase RecQ [Vibrio hippocampi]|uniref:DNA helicase RecQ n=1 Tax=Vibrio hippocampi TaxID=654686 RepID=A0ABN8DNU1_9VIBR|nr:DNA helicase RecQ [Vibrio hippocampi]CAH0530342.1 ATP-dependent DNA helicase RecQ [Vibrio hippocampi]